MANTSKDKGDRFERKAVQYLLETVPSLISVSRPMRALGAGRLEDTGDLHVFHDTAIQVRALADLGKAVRSSAADSVLQAHNADVPFALGMVPVPRARAEQVNWLSATLPDQWPFEVEPVVEFSLISKALDWVRDDVGYPGYRTWPRIQRIGLLSGKGTPTLIAPMEAWLHAYETTRSGATVNTLTANDTEAAA